MNPQELIDIARALVADNKGLLAMDESNPTCNKRSARLGISQTKESLVLAAQQASQVQPGCVTASISQVRNLRHSEDR